MLRTREINVRARDADRETLLHLAASAGHLKAYKHLCDIGASINNDGANSKTPSHCAASINHVPIIWLLLSQGADGSNDEDDGGLAVGCTTDHLLPEC